MADAKLIHNVAGTTPTTNSPIEIILSTDALPFDLIKIIVYVKATGEILKQLDVAEAVSSQKEKWITSMAHANGCIDVIQVQTNNAGEVRELFKVTCKDKTLEITCEFTGEISEANGGLPYVAVAGNQTQPACWR